LNFSTALIFLGLGFLFLATDTWVEKYPRPTRIYIGLVLLAWAAFRMITVYLKFRRAKQEEDEQDVS
jgi:hypothetical protein